MILRKCRIRLQVTQTEEQNSVDKASCTENVIQPSEKVIKSEEINLRTFLSYPCFYCGSNIVSECELKEHSQKCHGCLPSSNPARTIIKKQFDFSPIGFPSCTPSFVSRPSPASFSLPIGFPQPTHTQTFPYPNSSLSLLLPKCEHCGWKASSGTELVNHKKSVHADHRNPFEVYKQF